MPKIKIYLVKRADRAQIIARKWTEDIASAMANSPKGARIYVCKEKVESDIRPNAFEYNYVYLSKDLQIYLINACANYGEKLKAQELVERFFGIYPTPLMLEKPMTFLVNLLTENLLSK